MNSRWPHRQFLRDFSYWGDAVWCIENLSIVHQCMNFRHNLPNHNTEPFRDKWNFSRQTACNKWISCRASRTQSDFNWISTMEQTLNGRHKATLRGNLGLLSWYENSSVRTFQLEVFVFSELVLGWVRFAISMRTLKTLFWILYFTPQLFSAHFISKTPNLRFSGWFYT